MTEILVIEDVHSDAELLIRALNIAGITNPVRRLVSGADALIYLTYAATIAPVACSIPSVLFLDLRLPKINGLEILEQIVRIAAFAKTLRIVLSHIDDTKTIQRAYDVGAHTFLTKPIRQSDLTELITAFPGYWTFDLPSAPEGVGHIRSNPGPTHDHS